MSPMIPVNPDDLPVNYETIDEDTVARAVCRSFKVASKTDKNGGHYSSVDWEIITPEEFSGRVISDNYVPFMLALSPNMTDGARRKAMERGIRLNRIAASAGIKLTQVPVDDEDFDSAEVDTFLEETFVGAETEFTVSINEYQGRKNNKVKEYLLNG